MNVLVGATWRVAMRQYRMFWICVGLCLATAVALGVLGRAPRAGAEAFATIVASTLVIVAAMFLRTTWIRMRRASLLRVAPAGLATLRGAVLAEHVFALVAGAGLAGLLLVAGLEPRHTLQGLAVASTAYASGVLMAEVLASGLPRWSIPVLTMLLGVALMLPVGRVTHGHLLSDGLLALCLASGPLVALGLARREEPFGRARRAGEARGGAVDRFGDAVLRGIFVMLGGSGRRPDPIWLLAGAQPRYAVLVKLIGGFAMGSALFESGLDRQSGPNPYAALGAMTWLFALVVSDLTVAGGFERLMLMPRGLLRPALPGALRRLKWLHCLPAVLAMFAAGLVWWLYRGPDTASLGAYLNTFAVLVIALAVLQLFIGAQVVHPALVRHGAYTILLLPLIPALVLGFIGVEAWLGLGRLSLDAPPGGLRVLFLQAASVQAELLAIAGVAGASSATCLVMAWAARRSWRRANLPAIVQVWREQAQRQRAAQEGFGA